MRIPIDENLRLWKYLCKNRERRRTLRDVMESKFKTDEYRDALVRFGENSKVMPKEVISQVKDINPPVGYTLDESNEVLRDIRIDALSSK